MNRVPLLALCLIVAGCGDQSDAPAEQGGEASGEVLEGSISDAMIPLEQLDSQAPLAPPQAQAAGEDIDAEQPDVSPVPGIEGEAAGEGAGTAPVAPAPAPAQ